MNYTECSINFGQMQNCLVEGYNELHLHWIVGPFETQEIRRNIIGIIIHLKYFPVSDWLKPHA